MNVPIEGAIFSVDIFDIRNVKAIQVNIDWCLHGIRTQRPRCLFVNIEFHFANQVIIIIVRSKIFSIKIDQSQDFVRSFPDQEFIPNNTKMRKQWVKRENIYHKPFYKQKLKMTLLGVLLMAVVFFAYQLFYIKQLQTEIEHKASIVPMHRPNFKENRQKIIR